MRNEATPGQREMLGDITRWLTPKFKLIIRRYKYTDDESLPGDFISISTTPDNRTHEAVYNYFRKRTEGPLKIMHSLYGDRFRENENPEGIYDWIETATSAYDNPNITIELWESKERSFRAKSFDRIQKHLTAKEKKHVQHLIQNRQEALKFLSNWQYEDHLPALDFNFRLYNRQAIILFYGLMKTQLLRIRGNENSEIDLEVFKNFMVSRVATMPKNNITPRDPYDLKWNELNTPREEEIEQYFKQLKLHELPEISELHENSMNNEHLQKKEREGKEHIRRKTFTAIENALEIFFQSIDGKQGKQGKGN